jgi:hypothetical protein
MVITIVRIHGNYCGPNWTAGKARPAADINKLPYVAPTDSLDAACRQHDLACSEGGCSSKADNRLRNSALLVALTQPRLREVALLVAAGMTVAAPTRKR